MARSSYVYVVLCLFEGHVEYVPVAAFTVKHELVAWLRQPSGRPAWGMLTVFRMPDGGRHVKPTRLFIADLLEG